MLDIETLKRAIEGRDAQALSKIYAEDAALIVMDRDNTPRSPRLISGQKAISAYYDDVCGRDMQHELVAGVSDDAHLAFTEACTYPDGTRVFCSAMAEVIDGKISKQTNVQVWDS
jgi:ketosteroid isomerase-like protein